MSIQCGRAQRQELQSPALVRLNVHGISAVVVVRERMKCQTHLLQVSDALRLAGTEFAFGNDWQQQGGENGNDGDHHQQLDKRKSTPTRTMPESIHGFSLVSTNQHFGCRDDL
jgi:hypothetical protein